MAEILNPARHRLMRGELSLGVGIRISRSIEIARLMKSAGFDWLFLDLEHGMLTLDACSQIAIAALDAGITPIVRVPERQYDMAARALDGGCWGVVMPHVDTADEAREMVDHLRYPPEGHRSSGGMLPHLGYRAMNSAEAARIINGELLLVAMVETPTSVANAEAIAAVPGIDGLLIGSNDLSLEMGIAGQFTHPKMVEAYDTVIAACRKHGKFPGMGGVSADDLFRRYIAAGMRMILGGNDIPFLIQGAAQRTTLLRGCL
jgi:2-keto-3-deoxy-L-rhamnonate aldolase RhmA